MKRIIFDRKFELIVCLDAKLPDATFFSQFSHSPVFAADGAALKLFDIGIMPDYIIGDLDTLMSDQRSAFFENERIIKLSDQETNDFEKTLITAINMSFNNVLITGFHGGELEHTLNNWSIFKKYSNKLNLCIFDCNRYGFSIDSDVAIHLETNEIISILPQPEIVLTTENLMWNLNNETLKFGIREGARNRTTLENVYLRVHSGSAIVFINQRLPYYPRFEKNIL